MPRDSTPSSDWVQSFVGACVVRSAAFVVAHIPLEDSLVCWTLYCHATVFLPVPCKSRIKAELLCVEVLTNRLISAKLCVL